MNKKEFKRKGYMKPQITVIATQQESLLQNGSGNAGMITPGGEGGDAKRWTGEFDEDEENLPAENGSSYSQYRVWEE